MADATALDITAAEIRQRLVTLTSADVSDTIAGDASHKLVADAWAGRILSKNGQTVITLSADQAALLKAAKLDYTALRIITDANLDDFDVGPIRMRGTKASDKKTLLDSIKQMISETLDIAGLVLQSITVSDAGEGDYTPSGTDATQIDIAQADSDYPFSVWSV